MTEGFDFKVEKEIVRLSDGGRVAIRRWGGEKPERIVMSHGNGLAIDGFYEFATELMDHFEVVAFDMRSHGQSGPGEVVENPWPRFVADIPEIYEAIQTRFGEKPMHGAFHSLSSIATLMAQSQTPLGWRSLTLFEPPVPPVADVELLEEFEQAHRGLSRRTRARRRRFSGPERLVRSLRRSPTFGGIPDAVTHRLAEAMLYRADHDPEAPYELVCDPDLEANTFDIKLPREWWDGLASVQLPVQVVVGTTLGHDLPVLIRTASFLAQTFGFACAAVEGGGHLMQMQRPQRSAEHALRFATANGAAGGD
ncbi:hypothetical protein A3731_18545 [Roseovarius sp. HI0049]|nr:hypothetical protein A3731_18545 [Roseovarius sp. HI0049]